MNFRYHYHYYYYYRNNCNGNDRCVSDCGGNRGGWNNHDVDRCHGCGGCPGNNPPQQLTHCPMGKSLYYVQIPKTISLNDFVSNPAFLQLYNESNLELDVNGISGRACLTDQNRLDLTRLGATFLPVPMFQK